MADKPKKPQKLRARLPRGLEDRGPAAIAATWMRCLEEAGLTVAVEARDVDQAGGPLAHSPMALDLFATELEHIAEQSKAATVRLGEHFQSGKHRGRAGVAVALRRAAPRRAADEPKARDGRSIRHCG